MPEPTTSAGDDTPAVIEDQAIRQRVKGLTSQVLQEGRVDPDAVRDVVRAMIGGTPGNAAAGGAEARELFDEHSSVRWSMVRGSVVLLPRPAARLL
jgi:hypothetical protein